MITNRLIGCPLFDLNSAFLDKLTGTDCPELSNRASRYNRTLRNRFMSFRDGQAIVTLFKAKFGMLVVHGNKRYCNKTPEG